MLWCRQGTLTEENAGGKMIKTIVRRLSVFMIIFLISGLPGVLSHYMAYKCLGYYPAILKHTKLNIYIG